ncbi:hypothetical protein BDP81DRAFT_135754 [Colletotrichum phormii]|uniref:Uncharacterized protein n=1 Tax=Colletotrichum phormii TaxID=359342 RepID=A0AAJ0A3S7_9PEZI|nr:uncharacterized protein BDP81DRAFT_135754 [Colletotrichum phormii]KAK1641522.1 hypothetical protein BDP81DRAFT_135754 [Colletotrichum phormii]
MMGVAAIELMIFPGVLTRGLPINVALPICEGELSNLERLWPANALSAQEHRQRHQHSNTLDCRAAVGIAIYLALRGSLRKANRWPGAVCCRRFLEVIVASSREMIGYEMVFKFVR